MSNPDIVFSQEDYRQLLQNALSEKHSIQADSDKSVEAQISGLRAKLEELELSYETHVKILQNMLDGVKRQSHLSDRTVVAEYIRNGNFDELRTYYLELRGSDSAELKAHAQYQLGKMAHSMADYSSALACFTEAVQYIPDQQEYRLALGDCALQSDHIEAAIDNLEYAVALKKESKETQESQEPQLSEILCSLGFAYKKAGQTDKALAQFLEALELDRGHYGDGHKNVASIRRQLGHLYRAQGQIHKSIGLYEQALNSDLENYGESHPVVCQDWKHLAWVLCDNEQYSKAILYFEKALESDLKSLGLEHSTIARDWHNLGWAWSCKRRFSRAIEYYQKALESDLKNFGPQNMHVMNEWTDIGRAWYGAGENDKAIEYYEKALEAALEKFGPEHKRVALEWNRLGTAYHEKSDYKKAKSYFEKALPILIEALGEEHQTTKVVKSNLEVANNAL